MTGRPPAAMLLVFPCFHPALAGEVPAGARFLDPGLAEAGEGLFWRPESLPLAAEALSGFLREFDRLRREVKNPKDLALLAGASGGHFFNETSFAVREEYEDARQPERVAARRAKTAQLALCLAYMIEENLLDLASVGELDAAFRKGLAESLGLGADGDADEEEESLAAALAGAGDLLPAASLSEEFRPPWRQILPSFWAFVPEDAGLFVSDPDMAATLFDAGLLPTEADADMATALFPDAAEKAVFADSVPGWRLLGHTRPMSDFPWLDRPRLIVAVKP